MEPQGPAESSRAAADPLRRLPLPGPRPRPSAREPQRRRGSCGAPAERALALPGLVDRTPGRGPRGISALRGAAVCVGARCVVECCFRLGSRAPYMGVRVLPVHASAPCAGPGRAGLATSCPPGRGLASSVLQAHSRGPPLGLAQEGRTLARPEQTLNLWPPGEAWLRVGRQRRGPQRVGPFPPERRPRLRLGLFTEAVPGPLPAWPLSTEGDLNLGCRSHGPSGAVAFLRLTLGLDVAWTGAARGLTPGSWATGVLLTSSCSCLRLPLSLGECQVVQTCGGAARFPTLDTGVGTAAARLVRPLLAPAGGQGVRGAPPASLPAWLRSAQGCGVCS